MQTEAAACVSSTTSVFAQMPTVTASRKNVRRYFRRVDVSVVSAGQLPAEMGQLSCLQDLRLHSNRLSGERTVLSTNSQHVVVACDENVVTASLYDVADEVGTPEACKTVAVLI